MDYEKAYKEALERAKEFKSPYCQHAAEVIFPELKESEDERIRKEIISFITDRKNWFPKEETKSSWIAWLEKQKDTNVLIQEAYEKAYTEGMRVERKHWLEKQDKKSSWSEEDSKNLNSVKRIIENSENLNKIFETIDSPDYIKKYFIDWLKSLKPRWKPTEEQMEALKYFISFHSPQANAAVEGWKEFKNLESLYNDLKSL